MAITVDTNFKVSNPKTVAIANMAELSGARTVKTIDDLYSLPEILADSVGQEWYVEDIDAVYRLTDFEKRNSAEGWIDVDYTPVSKLKVNGSPVVNYNIAVNSLNSNFDGTTPVITGITNDKQLSLKNEDSTPAFYAHNFVTVTDGEDYLVTSTSSGWVNHKNPGGAIKIAGDGSSYRKVFDLTCRGAYAEPGMYLIGTFTQNDFESGVYEYEYESTTPSKEGIYYSTTGEEGTWTRSTSWDTLYEQIAWRNDSQAAEMKRRRSGNIFSIAKGDIYVAANAWGGGLFWSEDGKNWNVSQIYASVEDKSGDGQCNGAFNAVCYANGIYVAGNGQSYNNSTFRDRFGLHWSTDGKKWYQSHINYPWARINSIAYGNGTFVAVGNGYTNTDKNGQPTANSVVTTGSYTSTDGKNWVFNAVYESDSRDDQGFLNVTYSENAESFIVPEFGGAADNPYGGIWRSFDGKAWFRISDIKDNWGSACSIKSKNTAIVINDDATVFITNNVKKTFLTVEGDQIITGNKTFDGELTVDTLSAKNLNIDNLNISETTVFSDIPVVGEDAKPLALEEDITNALVNYTTTADLENLLDAKADSATTLSGYGITNAYTKSEADAKFIDNSSNEDIGGNKSFTGEVTINTLTATTLNLTNLNIEGTTTFSDVPVVGPDGKPLALEEDIPTDYITESELANAIANKADKSEIANKADKATTLAGYDIDDAYTKTEADNKFVDKKSEQIIEGNKEFTGNVTIDTLNVNQFEVDKLSINESTTFNGSVGFANIPYVNSTDNLLALKSEIPTVPTDYVTTSELNSALSGKADVGASYTKTEASDTFVLKQGNEEISGKKEFKGEVVVATLSVNNITSNVSFAADGTATFDGSTVFNKSVSFAVVPTVKKDLLNISLVTADTTINGVALDSNVTLTGKNINVDESASSTTIADALDNISANLNGKTLWTGTNSEYNAITEKSDNTIYFIVEG